MSKKDNDELMGDASDIDESLNEVACGPEREPSLYSKDVTYHLILEGLDVSYRIDDNSNVIVEKVSTLLDFFVSSCLLFIMKVTFLMQCLFSLSLPTSPTRVLQGIDVLTP